MKAVDFIVERTDSYLFIEFKDPRIQDRPGNHARHKPRKEFSRNFKRGKLGDQAKDEDVRAAEMQSCANLLAPISVHLSVNQRCRH